MSGVRVSENKDIVAALLAMNGIAAVNLEEPSAGDLERVVKAYALQSLELSKAKREIELLRAQRNRPFENKGKFYPNAVAEAIKYLDAEITEELGRVV